MSQYNIGDIIKETVIFESGYQRVIHCLIADIIPGGYNIIMLESGKVWIGPFHENEYTKHEKLA